MIGPSSACPGLINVAAIRSTGLSASLGIAEHAVSLVSDQGVTARARPAARARDPAPRRSGRSVVAAQRPAQIAGGMTRRLVLGRRRGHDGRQGRAVRRAPAPGRRGPARQGQPPSPTWLGRAGRRGGAERRGGGRGRGARATRPARWSRAGSTTRASRCWRGTPRPARRSPRSWCGRTSARRRSSTASATDEEEIQRRSGLPFDPYFSAAKLAWLLEHDEAVARAREAGHAAHGHGRLVPLRPARGGLRHGRIHRLAHPAPRARHPRLRPVAVRALRRAARRCCQRCVTPSASSAPCATRAGRWSCR